MSPVVQSSGPVQRIDTPLNPWINCEMLIPQMYNSGCKCHLQDLYNCVNQTPFGFKILARTLPYTHVQIMREHSFLWQ